MAERLTWNRERSRRQLLAGPVPGEHQYVRPGLVIFKTGLPPPTNRSTATINRNNMIVAIVPPGRRLQRTHSAGR